jgi:hypothetical protein
MANISISIRNSFGPKRLPWPQSLRNLEMPITLISSKPTPLSMTATQRAIYMWGCSSSRNVSRRFRSSGRLTHVGATFGHSGLFAWGEGNLWATWPVQVEGTFVTRLDHRQGTLRHLTCSRGGNFWTWLNYVEETFEPPELFTYREL